MISMSLQCNVCSVTAFFMYSKLTSQSMRYSKFQGTHLTDCDCTGIHLIFLVCSPSGINSESTLCNIVWVLETPWE